jgi:YggT family protein
MRELLDGALRIYEAAIVIRAVLSWFQQGGENRFEHFLAAVTDPVLAPIRKLLNAIVPIPGVDLSPIAALLLIEFLRSLLR